MEPTSATLTTARAIDSGADRDPAPGRQLGPVQRAWASLRSSDAPADRTPSPPTLETFFNLVG
jgi:hypothetical protein